MFAIVVSRYDDGCDGYEVDRVYGPYEAHEVEPKKKLLEERTVNPSDVLLHYEIMELLDIY